MDVQYVINNVNLKNPADVSWSAGKRPIRAVSGASRVSNFLHGSVK